MYYISSFPYKETVSFITFNYNCITEVISAMDEQFPIVLSVRIDDEMHEKLKLISLYEKMKKSELVRRWLLEKIRTYERNPAYKRWLKLKQGYEGRK